MKHLVSIIHALLGRRLTYRFGRALYLQSRGDIANGMDVNGEILVQTCVVDAWARGDGNGDKLVAFDIGANVGEWSRRFAETCADKAVSKETILYSFEPVPDTAQSLKNNTANMQLVHHIKELAMSSATGRSTIFVNRAANAGTNSLHPEYDRAHYDPVEIILSTIDAFCAEQHIDAVALAKCDTEGHDFEVIKGAVDSLKTGRVSVLQFEYNFRWCHSRNFLRDVFEVAQSTGYQLAKLQRDHLLVFDKWHPELEKFFEGNYALIHPKAMAWFPTKPGAFDDSNALVVG